MQFFSASALRTDTKEMWRVLDRDEDVILTTNGKPRALVIDIPDGNLEMSLKIISSVRAMLALQQSRAAAIEQGVADMSMTDIDAEIAAYRSEKHSQEDAD